MALTVVKRLLPTALLAEVSGRMTLHNAEIAFAALLRDCLGAGRTRLLVDLGGVTGAPGTLERHLFGRFVADQLAAAALEAEPVRVAFVAREPLADPGRLAEMVARNRGALLRIFDDTDHAAQWLGLQRARELAADGTGA
jgi:hypothetical protein